MVRPKDSQSQTFEKVISMSKCTQSHSISHYCETDHTEQLMGCNARCCKHVFCFAVHAPKKSGGTMALCANSHTYMHVMTCRHDRQCCLIAQGAHPQHLFAGDEPAQLLRSYWDAMLAALAYSFFMLGLNFGS